MKIPLYNIFGDNYILQIAREVGEENIDIQGDSIEILNYNKLVEVLSLAAQLAETKERQLNRPNILPLSGNDKKPWIKALGCYDFNDSTPLSEILRNFSNIRNCNKVSLPSFVKPEFYEYTRTPGMVGRNRKKDIKVEPHYLIIASAGWLLTRIGNAAIGEGNYVGLNVFTPSKEILYSIVKSIGGRLIPGIKPETAFALWLAIKVVNSTINPNVSLFNIYLVSDASRKNPTTIKGGFSVDLVKLLEKKELLNNKLERIAENALNIKSDMRDRYIVLINYIYDYLTGSKKLEDLLYFANRDLLMNLESNDQRIRDLHLISSYVNQDLVRK